MAKVNAFVVWKTETAKAILDSAPRRAPVLFGCRSMSKDHGAPTSDKTVANDSVEENRDGGRIQIFPQTKKPFRFCKRLWHEPPDLDYRYFEIHELLPKELKIIGGKDLEWGPVVMDDILEQRETSASLRQRESFLSTFK